jgi:site-specific DNA-methyltransferase (adenine-specific)
MSSKIIKLLPFKNIAKENAILLICTTDYHLEKCIEVINAWGFTYKTVGFCWSKRNKNNTPVTFMGAYTMKSGVELCLLATKGKNARKLLKKHNVRAYIESERQHHSKKPDEIRNRINELFGDVSKIELFARNKYENWDSWGNEI